MAESKSKEKKRAGCGFYIIVASVLVIAPIFFSLIVGPMFLQESFSDEQIASFMASSVFLGCLLAMPSLGVLFRKKWGCYSLIIVPIFGAFGLIIYDRLNDNFDGASGGELLVGATIFALVVYAFYWDLNRNDYFEAESET
ncbi:MAG: hypothetical protein AAF902_19095 [Chloroflexota bacterium]